MKKYYLFFIFSIFFVSYYSGISAQISNSKEKVLLPNGQTFNFWDDQTVYRKVYYVDQNNPIASDENIGTEDRPFVTINRAVKIANPGDKILVKKGIYREDICPLRGGVNEKSMICYEAAPNAEVIISGSDVLKESWVISLTPNPPSQYFSQKLWMTSVPRSYFKETSPFLIQNLNAYEIGIMSWAKDWTNRVPYTLVRGLIFQDGRRMTQLCAYEDIVKLPGSYWVDTTHNNKYACTIHIHPFLEKNPNNQVFEITTRQSTFNPKVKGINYIHVKGFIFEQVGNGFSVTCKGAFSTYGGSHWIIENNIFRKINSVAIEIGAITNRHIEKERYINTLEDISGRHIVRNNIVFDCGTGGIQGLMNEESLVENNYLFDIGWQEAEFYYETAAIKLHETLNCLIRRNHIRDIEAADGIWLDAGNNNTRVTQNLIYNVNCFFGGIFIEVSNRPCLVDHNLVWNCSENGIYQLDVDSLYIVHNIVGRSKEYAIRMKSNQGRIRGDGSLTTARHNKILYNLLIDNESAFNFSDTINISDYNYISSSQGKSSFNWNDWKMKGFDKNSRIVDIKASFDPSDLVFKMEIKSQLPKIPRLPFINEDLIGRKYEKQEINPGGLIDNNIDIHLDKYFRK